MADPVLHLALGANQVVWGAFPGQAPKSLALLARFEAELVASGATRLALVGVDANVPLVVQACAWRDRGLVSSVRVCGPMAAPLRSDRDDVSAQLASALRWRVPASLGGWFEAGPCLQASMALRQDPGQVVSHPLWPSLSFITGVDPIACARLIAFMLDPRWQVNLARPDSSSRLYRRLGLMPADVRAAIAEGAACQRPVAVVLAAFMPATALVFGPGGFLGRYYREVWARRDDAAMAMLRTGQLFARYLRDTWLDVADEVRCADGALFDCAGFFRQAEEAEAWRAHVASHR